MTLKPKTLTTLIPCSSAVHKLASLRQKLQLLLSTCICRHGAQQRRVRDLRDRGPVLMGGAATSMLSTVTHARFMDLLQLVGPCMVRALGPCSSSCMLGSRGCLDTCAE